jgi:hypothetical protein
MPVILSNDVALATLLERAQALDKHPMTKAQQAELQSAARGKRRTK